MKATFAILLVTTCLCFSCSKYKIQPVGGTINGMPAITLYGSSAKPTDYIFISKAAKEMAYNGNTLTYTYTSSTTIFMSDANGAVARAILDTANNKILLTIDTTYGYTFASSLYVSY